MGADPTKWTTIHRRTGMLICGLVALVVASAMLLAVRIALTESATWTIDAGSTATAVSEGDALALVRVFPTRTKPSRVFYQNFWASPQLIELTGLAPFLLVTPSGGLVAALEPGSGRTIWNVRLPCEPAHEPFIQAAPTQVGDRLIVAYMWVERLTGERSYHAAVVDLRRGKLDYEYPVIEFSAEVRAAGGAGTVPFNPSTHNNHGTLAHIPSRTGLGHVYVQFGSFGDVDGWHGWLFELDLDAWLLGPPNKAISAAFVTTPETDCDDGTAGKICGGGIWAYSAPQIYRSEGGFEIVVQTGNGRLNLERGDYAQSLLRLRPGLKFTPDCDPHQCAGADPASPSEACLSSCKNLFVPRLGPGDPPLRPSDGSCDDKSYLECLEANDWDFGANAPLRLELASGFAVYVAAGKAGDVFLLDAERMGVMYDRRQVATLCGTREQPCPAVSEGVSMTQPQAGWVDGNPVVVLPTYNPDGIHAAGIVAYKIVTTGGRPRFEDLWRVPDPSTPEAKQWFRAPPTRPVIQEIGGQPVVWVADNSAEGRVLGIRLRDGRVLANVRTAGWPMRNAKPVLYRRMLYLPTAVPSNGNLTWIEAYQISRRAS